MKSQIVKLITQADTKKAIELLIEVTKSSYLQDEVALISAKFKKYQQSERLRTLDQNQLGITLNQINQALLDIANKLSESDINISHDPFQQPRNTVNNTILGQKEKTDKNSGFWKYFTVTALIIGLLGSLAEVFNVIDIVPSSNKGKSNNSLTVFTHTKNGKDDIVLGNRGIVYLIYGDAKVPEQINNEGEATFKQLPSDFFDSNNKVELLFEDPEGESYKASFPDSLYQLVRGKPINLIVELQGMDRIEGLVKDYISGNVIED